VQSLVNQISAINLEKLQLANKEYFTVKEVAEIYDISERLQQEERSAGRLGYLKKEEGKKILYTVKNIKSYLNTYYVEHIANPKPSCHESCNM
jgi:uncharacterized protein YlaN (UPF0358 family)